MIWSANFLKDTCIILAYSTSKINKPIVDFINFYPKKKVLPIYFGLKSPSNFSL